MNQSNPLDVGVVPRALALDSLFAWDSGEGYLAENQRRFIGNYPDIDKSDRALALEIAMGTLRHIRLLEENLKRYVKHPPEKGVELLLLMALYQFWWMERVPAYAVVNATVDLARMRFGDKRAGFVNAVLRRASGERLKIPEKGNLGDLAIRYSHPGWLVQKWNEQLGFKKMALRLKSNNMLPVQWVRLTRDPELRARALEELPLDLDEVRFERYYPVKGGLRELLHHPLFALGAATVQDPAAWLLVKILGLHPGDRLLDLCAAPGGKSALVLDECPGVELVAADSDFRRLSLIKDLEERQGHTLSRVVADGRHPPFVKGRFTHLLLDAPCSNLGVVRRRPEALWRVNPATLQRTVDLQSALLEGAASVMGEGGVIVYGTCSPEPEETFEVIERFLDAHPDWRLDRARDYIPRRYVERHCLQVIPAPGSVDGFFGARLVHRAAELIEKIDLSDESESAEATE